MGRTIYICGIEKKDEKNYVRDIIVSKDEVGNYYYEGLSQIGLTKVKYNEEEDILARGIEDYMRGGKNIHYSKVGDTPKELIFASNVRTGKRYSEKDKGQGYGVGFGDRLNRGAYVYKQEVKEQEGRDYYILRVEFKSDGEEVRVFGSRVKILPKQNDATVHGVEIIKGLNRELLKIVEDTLYLYGVSEKIKEKMIVQSIIESERGWDEIGYTNKEVIEKKVTGDRKERKKK